MVDTWFELFRSVIAIMMVLFVFVFFTNKMMDGNGSFEDILLGFIEMISDHIYISYFVLFGLVLVFMGLSWFFGW